MKPRIAIIENNIIATLTIREKLTQTLIEKGYDVLILTTGKESELAEAATRGYRVVDVKGSTQNPLDIFHYLRNLRKALKDDKPQICLTFTIRPAIWGNLVTRRLQIPTITNITGIGPLFERNNLAYRAARTLYKFVLQKTSRIFFQNFDDLEIFVTKKFVDRKNARRIPGSGVDPEKYQPLPNKRTSRHFQFLFISRLVKDKGIGEYVSAAKKLKPAYPEVEFAVLGPLWNQNLKDNTVSPEELQNWQDEGIIKYFGETKDVRPYIANANCIVLPSYREGSSNVLLEASAMERPCITCHTTGCKEIVEDGVTGFLCEVRNVEDLANQMKKMLSLSPESRMEMGKKARQKVIREFDKQIVIDAYLEAIQQLTQPS
ncbi:MAG: glycosyltransferase family 4 protein [Ferruginibacter sp.]|nr:glycosyltransferase family 4 protein [Bacteroidota bacterium]MCW5915819.1 glycosyltransferase family 4 protein [Ferruginibacter sp.]